MTKVSVIVPIYNVEKYLRRSIESIQKQTLKDIEIILVNDGSSDGSIAICEEYQKKDNRIEIIDKSNGGVSSARNAGLEIAKGDYIGFVDPDDWIEPNMYEDLYKQIKTSDTDVCMCNYVIENNGKSIPNLLNIKQVLLEKEDIVRQIVAEMIGSSSLNSAGQTIMGSVCRLIVKKELINNNNFRFELGIPLMEDLIFCIQILLKSKKVSINTGLNYHYIINSNSSVFSYRENMIDIQRNVYSYLEKLLKKDKKVYSIVEKRLNFRYTNMCIGSIANEVHRNNSKRLAEKIKFIKEICKDKKLKSILKELDMKGYTLRKKLILIAIKYELVLYIFLYYLLLMKITTRID